MPDFHYEPMFQLGGDETEYRPLEAEGLVDKTAIGGREVLVIDPKALRLLAAEATRDVSHLFRPAHLAQLRAILDDPDASDNDRFVALEMLKNADASGDGKVQRVEVPERMTRIFDRFDTDENGEIDEMIVGM